MLQFIMKGNNGKAARRRHNQHILSTLGGMFGMLTLLTFLCYVMEIGPWDHYAYYDNAATAGQQQQQQLRRHRRNGGGHGPLEYLGGAGKPQSSREFRKSLSDQFQVGEKSEEEVLRQVLAAELQLITLVFMEEEIIHAPKNSYDGVYGKFCKLDWTHRKRDPSAVPMFRDLVAQSEDCLEGQQYKFNLKKVADLARHQDELAAYGPTSTKTPKVLNFTAAAFHESRCGSTLVANAFAAMDSTKHRSYSESQPPASVMTNACGSKFTRCSKEQASLILRDVIYLMSRSDDPKEERVFFKFQSATTKQLDLFQMAFPDIPWLFVYRDPVQVIMSHAKDDPDFKKGNANCLRSRFSPPPEVHAIVEKHGISTDPRNIPPEQYCAAHLASITEFALAALNNNHGNDNRDGHGIPVNYQDLPDILYTTILPKILGRPLTSTEISNIQDVSHEYSKGRGSRHKEFQGDSEQKTNAASEAIKMAAATFLQPSYDQLAHYQSRLLADGN